MLALRARYAGITLALAIYPGLCLAQPPAPKQSRVPVIVELFTSEGCSTCPPADNLLSDLKQKQPVPGAEIIGLGFHVDYWDHDGWKDRFSDPKFTQREVAYDWRFHGEPYTPFVVVDGTNPMDGGNSNAELQAIAKSAASAKPVSVQIVPEQEQVKVNLTGPNDKEAEAYLAIVEDGVETSVKDGENKGKVLHHAAVVRDFRSLGHPKGDSWSATAPLKLPKDSQRSRMQAVVFVQNRKTGAILGASEVSLQ